LLHVRHLRREPHGAGLAGAALAHARTAAACANQPEYRFLDAKPQAVARSHLPGLFSAPMKIAVCLKRVLGSATRVRIRAVGKSRDEAGGRFVLSPYDDVDV